jgi:hypothetical protein
MDEASESDDELASGEWEPWLAQRFVAYLLRDADGRPRPIEEVERALARLSGRADAVSRLASLAFLLDPDTEVAAWVRDELPAFLRRVRVRSEVTTDLRRSAARGRIDWARTLAVRHATRDETWIASRSLVRTFDTPELVTVRYALDRVRGVAASFLRDGAANATGWSTAVAEMAASGATAVAHSALHDVPLRRPTPAERAIARASHDAAVRHAARIVDVHDELLPEPSSHRLRDALARFALVPLNEDTRFQVFALLAMIDSVERVAKPERRIDRVVESRRNEVVRWEGADFVLKLHYDQAAAAGVHLELMRHYFGRSQPLRPDLRLELTRAGVTRELIADAKRSTRPSYLADAHHKMRGYIADRPEAFAGSTLKAIVMCPAEVVGVPRPTDEVAFVGIEARSGVGLDDAIAHWWRSVRNA